MSIATRDQRLFGAGQKRILSLDGGGTRGMVSLGILESLEAHIDSLEGRKTCLGEWFDLIGGTSTGAIIATGLALGKRVSEIKAFYDAFAPQIFSRSWRRIPAFHAKFDARKLRIELSRAFGDRTLETPDLICGLGLALKRLDTGSAWLLMNNPRSAFWADAPDGGARGNRSMLLANIVRASTAAPSFFDPETIPLHSTDTPGVFIDGGVTPHNNPSLMLLLAGLLPAYGLNWTGGAKNLLVVSVGTGSFRPSMTPLEIRRSSAIGLALKSLAAMVSETQNQALTLMSYLGETPTPWHINSEIGEVASAVPPCAPLFRFLRYDVRLEADWLARELEQTVDRSTLVSLRRMDEPRNLARLHAIGRAAGLKQIRREHVAAFARTTQS